MRRSKTRLRKRWKPDEIRYLKKYYGKRSVGELSRVMGRSAQKIGIAAKVLGLRKDACNVPFERS
jgi:hypothetical protein